MKKKYSLHNNNRQMIVWGAMYVLGFGMETILANCHMGGVMLLLRSVLSMLVRNASPRGSMCFRCLMFSLSGPCELLFLLYFIASWTWVVVSVMLYPCMFCVTLLMDLSCALRVWQCLWICNILGVVLFLLLNVMEVMSVGGGALFNRPCMSS